MQKKTLELTQFLSAFAKADENVLRLVDEYDHLATDWVYGNDLFWDGSLPAKQIEIITGVVKNNVRR